MDDLELTAPAENEPMITVPLSYLENIEKRQDKAFRLQMVTIILMMLLCLTYMIVHDAIQDKRSITTVVVNAGDDNDMIVVADGNAGSDVAQNASDHAAENQKQEKTMEE